MKYILILGIFLISCTKEEQCKMSYLVTESSEASARDKCNGLANSHPTFKVITSQYIGCFTPKELKEAQKANKTVTNQICPGISFQVKTTVK